MPKISVEIPEELLEDLDIDLDSDRRGTGGEH